MRANSTNLLAAIISCVTLAVLGYYFYPVIVEVADKCWSNDDYSHGILLPFISIALLWMKRDEIRSDLTNLGTRSNGKFSWLGLLFLSLGLFVNIFASVSGQLLYFRWIALFMILVGMLFLVLGTSIGALFAPAVLLLFMARPIPESLIPILFNPLQIFAAKISAWSLEVLNVPVYVQGNVIEVPGLKLLVEEACSGMRSVMSMITVSMIVAYLLSFGFLGFIVITVLAIIVAIVLNVLRVTLTGILAHFIDADLATGFFHEFTGLVVFVVGFAIVYWLAQALLKLKGRSVK